MRRAGLLPAAVLLSVVLAGPAAADEIVLLDGSRMSGRVVSADEQGILFERTTESGTARMLLPRSRVRSIEFSPPSPDGGSPAAPSTPEKAVRDEWWLLESDGRVVGTRHLLLLPRKDDLGSVWRLEEQLTLFGSPKAPAVRVQRIEDVGADFRPRQLHYREVGDAGGEGSGIAPYECIRSGPVTEGVWKATERRNGAREIEVKVPEGALGRLSLRETIARKSPRTAGMADALLLDAGTGAVRTVRAGFARLGSQSGAGREDVMRVEDQGRALESRWVEGDPPRCVSEEVAEGVTAKPVKRSQAEAADASQEKPAAPVDPTAPVVPGADPAAAPTAAAKTLAILDPGFEIPIPGPSWTSETVSPSASSDASGRRVVAKMASSLLASDVRVEWEPYARGAACVAPADVETLLLARLKGVSPDLQVVAPRNAVEAVPGAWRMSLAGTLNGERVRTLVLVAERRLGWATLIATCPESAWGDAKPALEAVLAGFRWL